MGRCLIEDVHLGHIEIEAKQLACFDLDLGINHGQEAAVAAFDQEQDFRPEGLDDLHVTVDRHEVS